MGTDPRLQRVIDQLRVQFPTAWTGTLRELLEKNTANSAGSETAPTILDSARGGRNEQHRD